MAANQEIPNYSQLESQFQDERDIILSLEQKISIVAQRTPAVDLAECIEYVEQLKALNEVSYTTWSAWMESQGITQVSGVAGTAAAAGHSFR